MDRFADARGVMPIGGDVTPEIAALDRALVSVAERALALDRAGGAGMWRTWMIEKLAAAEKSARSAASHAISALPDHRPELRDVLERRLANLNSFLARYRTDLGQP